MVQVRPQLLSDLVLCSVPAEVDSGRHQLITFTLMQHVYLRCLVLPTLPASAATLIRSSTFSLVFVAIMYIAAFGEPEMHSEEQGGPRVLDLYI